MQKGAIRQTISIALAAVIAVALFAFSPAAASELSQDEIDRIMSMRAAPYREDAELEPLPPGMVYLDDGTPYIWDEDAPPMLSPEETAKRIETYTSSMTPKWETPKPALKTTAPAKFAAPQMANIWSRYINKLKGAINL